MKTSIRLFSSGTTIPFVGHRRSYGIIFNLLFFLCFPHFLAEAQYNKFREQVVPPSPEVSALAKFADVTISKYSGLPTVSIPMYTISLDDFELPIELVYHHGGIKVEEMAGWAGLGWALNAGGSISRTVKGLPDESSGAISGYINHQRDPERFSWFQTMEYFNSFNNGNIDFEQDIFFFAFGDYSGKFVLTKDRKVSFINASNLDISFTMTNNRIVEWRVRDPKGNTYFFREIERTVAEPWVSSRGGKSNRLIDSAWHLSEIVTFRGKSIKFTYQSYSDNYFRRGTQTASYFVAGGSSSGACRQDRVVNSWVEYTVSGRQLSGITFDGGAVSVVNVRDREDSSVGRLKSITVRNTNNRIIKSFELAHDYFFSNLGNHAMNLPPYIQQVTLLKRLRLSRVIETTSSPNLVHAFDYEGNSLPHLFSQSQDHWGYFNGVFNQSLIPQYMRFRQANANRLVSPAYAKYGCLKKITFPTGGSITYEMESNTSMVSLKDYNDFFGPLAIDTNLPKYSVVVNQNIRRATLRVEPQLGLADSIKWFSYTVNLPTSVNCDGRSRDCIGTVDVGLYAARINHYISLTDGMVRSGQVQGRIGLRAGEIYQLSIDGPSNRIQGVSAAVVGHMNPPLVDEARQVAVNVGGLRVKEIVKDFLPQKERVKFLYEMPESSNPSGVLASFPKYDYLIIKETESFDPRGNRYRFPCWKFELRSVSQIPLGSSGAYFGYANVKEIKEVDNRQIRTDYSFYTALEFPDSVRYEFPFGVVDSKETSRGLPKSEVYYAHTSKGLRKSREINYTYNRLENTFHPNFFYACTEYNTVRCIKIFLFKYLNTSSWNPLREVTETSYEPESGKSLRKVRRKDYHPSYFLPIREEMSVNGNSETTEYFYPFNASALMPTRAASSSINLLLQRHRIEDPLMIRKTINGVRVEEERMQVLVRNQLPVVVGVDRLLNGGKRERELDILSHDLTHNIKEQKPRNGPLETFLWGYGQRYVTAAVTNAKFAEVAYTSFEAGDKGGWFFSGTPISSQLSKTGTSYYNLSRGSITKTNIPANSSRPFKISFWARRGSAPMFWTFMGKTEILSTQWKLIEREITGTTVQIIGPDIWIDELRLHPKDAQMVTFTHEPLLGITSMTDQRNRTTYFDYDAWGRLGAVRDADRNVLEHAAYHYQIGL